MLTKLNKFYLRCAPGHTEVCLLEIKDILQNLKGGIATVEKERDLGNTNSKNGIYVKTDDFKHGIEIAMKSLTIQDIECVIVDGVVCKSKRDVKRWLKKIEFTDFIPANSLSTVDDFNKKFKLHSRANKSIVNSSRFLKEEFCSALGAFSVQAACVPTDGDTSVQPVRDTPSGELPACEDADTATANTEMLNTIRLSLIENKLTVSVSLAGEMELYKRTYKDLSGAATAPLPEHHASACILWAMNTIHRKVNMSSSSDQNLLAINSIIVPFAGTGTLGFEGLLALLGGSGGLGSGLFSGRTFAFDSFPCASLLNLEICANGIDVRGEIVKCSDVIRNQMRSEIASKMLNLDSVNQDSTQDRNLFIPCMTRGMKILFSDINEDALISCKKNIKSFIQSSGNIISQSLFLEPKIMDFLKDDVCSFIHHNIHETNEAINSDNDVCSKTSSYNSGTCFVLLNPPFGLRLAKKSSTSSMYKQVATQLIDMRDKLNLLKLRDDQHEQLQLKKEAGTSTSTVAASCIHAPPKDKEARGRSVSLMGLCLCPDVKTWSTLITTLSAQGFGCETTHFSQGGNDTRAVCFWDDDKHNTTTS
jgi:hypothetical protein